MEEWAQITSAVVASCLGLLLVVLALILCFKWKKRHKWDPLREPPTPEWTPITNLKYTNLAADVTKSIPQTLDVDRLQICPGGCMSQDPILKSSVNQNYYPSRKHKMLPLQLYDDSSGGPPKPHSKKSVSSNPVVLQKLASSTLTSSRTYMDQEEIPGGDDYDEHDNDDDDEDEESPSPDRDSSLERSAEFLPQVWSTPDYHPIVEFCIIYLSSTNILAVHVKRIINLSAKYHSIAVKFKLKPRLHDSGPPSASQSSGLKTPKRAFDWDDGAHGTFSVASRSDLRHYDLCIHFFKAKFKTIRDKLLGKVVYSMAQIELCSEIPVTCLERMTICSKKKCPDSSKDNSTNSDLGQLMVSLFYQTTANRMKVLVRKASNLPKKKKVFGQSEYYVVVNAAIGGQIIACQETKGAHGRSPTWNHPMIFHLPQEDLDKYSFQFVVMTTKMSSHSASIGHIVIGPGMKGSGHDHWIEAVNPRSTESAKWHYLQPI